jgi:nucleoside phosphorylase
MADIDFVIVTALEEERDAVLQKLLGYKRHTPSDDDIRVYYTADLPVAFPDASTGAYRIAVMPLLGMGRVEATAATGDAIRRWNPRYILLVGIAGGIADSKVNLGDIVVSDQIVDYELQKLTSEGSEIRWEVFRTDPRMLGAVRNFPDAVWHQMISAKRPDNGKPSRHIGPIASGDKVIAARDILAKYHDKWPKLIAVEMEAAGVALASFQSVVTPRFFMIRGVSDLADEGKGLPQTTAWRSYACDVAASFAIALLKSGPIPLRPSMPRSSSVEKLIADIQSNLYLENSRLPYTLALCMDLVDQARLSEEYNEWLRMELKGFENYQEFKDAFGDARLFEAWMGKWASHRLIATYLKSAYRSSERLTMEILKLPYKKIFAAYSIAEISKRIETARTAHEFESSILLRNLGHEHLMEVKAIVAKLSPGVETPDDLQLFYGVSELDRVLNGVREKVLALLSDARKQMLKY